MRPLLLLPVAALALFAAPNAPAPPPLFAPAKPPDPRKRDAADTAIENGLEYLRTAQGKDGSWPADNVWRGGFGRPGGGVARAPGDIAVTSLAVMAFLSAGHVPGEGHYGPVVEAGVEWVISQQQPDGKLCAKAGGEEMYTHGIATLMLAEVVGMTRGAKADPLRQAVEKGVKVILAAQRKGGGGAFGGAGMAGGWRYSASPTAGDSDLSVTGWQLMALRSAKNVGCDVPERAITDAVGYVKRSYDKPGGGGGKGGVGFRYQPNGLVTVPCTAVGVLCLELSGKEQHLCDEALHGGAYLLDHPIKATDQHVCYGVYYVSQALFQLGGNYWETYRPKLHALLLRDAPPNAGGGWVGLGGDGATIGTAYSTSMAVLSLTVEYRLLPIYQRFEEPLERDGRE